MFVGLNTRQWCTRDGEQRASGAFLVVCEQHYERTRPRRPELRAFVRSVEMRQCGHFMMGSATVYDTLNDAHKLTLSGTYGSDGLPKEVPSAVFARLVPLPPELQDAFWSGGGHNSAGSEEPAIRKWVDENLTVLRNAAIKLRAR